MIRYHCTNVLAWQEHGEEFVDCKCGKMSEDGDCPEHCTEFHNDPNNGETGFGDTEPFVCDACHNDSVGMYELSGIQVCKGCYKLETT